MIAPTGTRTPTEPDRDGTQRKRTTINTSGAIEIFQFLLTYTTASPPNSAGNILSKAGLRVGEFRIGVSGTSRATPTAMITVVTIEDVATAIVEITSPSSVPGFTRIIRSAILTVVGQEYVEAARACGMGDFRIIMQHIIPNAIGPIIVQGTMSVADMIISAAGLSFLGMGIQPPQPEWGAMLSDAKTYMADQPYLVMFPGSAIVLASLALNLLGDGLRDALDPHLKN